MFLDDRATIGALKFKLFNSSTVITSVCRFLDGGDVSRSLLEVRFPNLTRSVFPLSLRTYLIPTTGNCHVLQEKEEVMTGIVIEPSFIKKIVVFKTGDSGKIVLLELQLLRDCRVFTANRKTGFVTNNRCTFRPFHSQRNVFLCFQVIQKLRQRDIIVDPKNYSNIVSEQKIWKRHR